jgi:hypothetical protein
VAESLIVSERTVKVLSSVLTWSQQQEYRGWNKHDGLNSPIMDALFGHWGSKLGRWPRMVAIQGVMRFPVNLRPLLLTPKTYNPKGLALFVHAYLDRYELEGNEEDLEEARMLLDLLMDVRSPGEWGGVCWGYSYLWQDPGFNAPAHTPNAVVTSFVCEAFLHAYRVTSDSIYLDTVQESIGFFNHDLIALKDTADELCLGYMPLPMTMRVMDVSILIGAVMAQYGELANDHQFDSQSIRLVRYVVNQQTDYGAWFYTDPSGDSRIRHDNYHTGFILDALERYMAATGDRQWQDRYDHGLAFYAEELFNKDGSPRWMSDVDYPHDIHGAAQGILTFSRHQKEYPGLAGHIADWAITNMYSGQGRFYYQDTGIFKKRFTLLRWCNAWMACALARYSKNGLPSV